MNEDILNLIKAEECFNEQTEAFTKLFENKEFFEKVMKAMGNALYSSLRQ